MGGKPVPDEVEDSMGSRDKLTSGLLEIDALILKLSYLTTKMEG